MAHQDISGYEFVWALEAPMAFAAGALTLWGAWRFFPVGRNRAFTFAANPGLGLVRVAMVLAGLWFWFVLATAADGGILGFYTLLYVLVAGACLLWGGLWRPLLGVWHTADVVERGNLAAAFVVAGFLLGTAFAFGGALSGQDASCLGENAGRDICQSIRAVSPGETFGTAGWHVVLVFFLLAYAELRANMALVDRLGGGLARQARLDRDVSAGILLGAVALASGLVSGRAAAGDFTTWGEAMRDYWNRLWPLLVIPPVAALVGFATTDRPRAFLARTLTAMVLVAGAGAIYVFT